MEGKSIVSLWTPDIMPDEFTSASPKSDFWDEVSGAQLKSDEAMLARLHEIRQLYSYSVYD